MKRIILIIIFNYLIIFSFSQIAKDKCKFIGNIISSSVPPDFSNFWNQVTPENSGKWGSVEATRDVMKWSALDVAYNYAITKGFPFKQHTFVWGQQYPLWIDNLSDTAKAAEVEEWIRLFSERYPKTDMIDVVNEPLHAKPSFKDAIGGDGTTGWDWVIWAFEKARKYCPKAKLILNDYNIINSNSNTDKFIGIVNLLKERNLIDGIGEQGHFLETTSIQTITQNLNKLAATGLPIYISEYDVNLSDDSEQLAKYKEQFPVFWNNNKVFGITLWGYQESKIWRTNAYLIKSDGSYRTALTWLIEYIKNNDCSILTNKQETNLFEKSVTFCNPVKNGNLNIIINYSLDNLKIIDLKGNIIKELNDIPANSFCSFNLNQGFYIINFKRNDLMKNEKCIVF
jgi:endo-1,4-beta-xylanase